MSRIQYIVNEPQAKAINDGASLLIVEIDDPRTIDKIENCMYDKQDESMIKKFLLPIKKGDNIRIVVGSVNGEDVVIERKVGEVSVKRVGDISMFEIKSLINLNYAEELMYWEYWLKDQGINYSANPWVALAELKEK